MRKLNFAISPCPNDTYIFGGLLLKKVPFPIEIDFLLEDVEKLNNLCIQGIYDVIKVSCAIYSQVKDKYVLLGCGGAIGRGCGPVVVSKKGFSISQVQDKSIGIPGKNTTAFYIFKKVVPDFKGRIIELRYDKIIPAILEGGIDAGILIHEARFTYGEYGLELIIDLGKWWEDTTSYPIPLGCILAKKELGERVIGQIEDGIKRSIEYAEKNLADIWPLIKQNAQEMDDSVIKKHIKTFVNEFSKDIGDEGRAAIEFLGS
ncbi:1,4-dihydroxy-6-naphthoate synthase [Desulfothermus sp.]